MSQASHKDSPNATPYGTLPPASPVASRKPISLPRLHDMRTRGCLLYPTDPSDDLTRVAFGWYTRLFTNNATNCNPHDTKLAYDETTSVIDM